MRIKAVVTDLDGTLLRSDATLSPYAASVFNGWIERGGAAAYATARSHVSAHPIVKPIRWRQPLIVYNGAMLLDPADRRVLGGSWLDPAATGELLALGRARGLSPFLFLLDREDTERVLHEQLVREGERAFFASRPGDPRFRELERLTCPEDCRTLIVTYIGRYEELKALQDAAKAALDERIYTHLMKDRYIPDHYFLEFSHPRANKRDGLRLWCELTGIDPQEVLVFGDQINDVGLFELAGTRVAVEGAHPSLLDLADAIAESNDADGVARYVARHLLPQS
ncbi:HAD family phosphatase [Paenibacillus sp. IB182496]|uniref:HAD family phosphatase n=1 Tax=Paenibacillus sabuli TaxID=2772509 RepID=A0A927GTX2_9BACL|nr:HAD family hydrolase [Paenibacillus sabuli]MBD2847756.1 HAD family phosphatase [Paenibacillus sabuli]